MMENLAGIAEAIKLGTKVTGILDRLTTDSNIREEFKQNGKIDGTFTLSHYRIVFSVYDEALIADAEVTAPVETPKE